MSRNSRKLFIRYPQLFLGVGFLALASCATSQRDVASLEKSPTEPSSAAQTKDEVDQRSQQLAEQVQAAGDASKKTPVTQVTLTFDQVSRDLGVPMSRLEQQAKILATAIEYGQAPLTLCNDEDDQSTEKLCSMIESYKSVTPGKAPKLRAEGRRVPIRPHHFASQQGMGYGRLMKSIHRETAQKILISSPRLLMTTSCPRNLSAVAIRKIETLLPSPVAKNMIEKLYEHASACLRPDDEGYETTHFRQALLRHLWGDKGGARKSIQKALVATDSDERARVLYWAGLLAADPAQRATHWKRLTDEYPLSFHALEVWQKQGKDPMQIFANRPPFTLNRNTLGAESEVDSALRWLEALYIIGRVDAAQKLARWITRVHKDDLAPSTMLYISLLKSGRSSFLNTITFFTRQVAENPVLINRQTLNILFPKPYIDVFDRNSPTTDTYLLLSVARQESGFNPRARSPMNARGLLQLLPSTARRLSGKRQNDLYDTEVNASLGSKFLSQLIDKFGSVELALAAYNAGPGRIDDWKERYGSEDLSLMLDLIPFKETRNYVSSILRNNYWYERLYRDDPGVISNIAGKSGQKRSEIVSRLVLAHSQANNDRVPASKF